MDEENRDLTPEELKELFPRMTKAEEQQLMQDYHAGQRNLWEVVDNQKRRNKTGKIVLAILLIVFVLLLAFIIWMLPDLASSVQ